MSRGIRVQNLGCFKRKQERRYFFLAACFVVVVLVAVFSAAGSSVRSISYGEYLSTVHLDLLPAHLETTQEEHNSNAPCSFEILQKWVDVSKRFPSDGNWSNVIPGHAIYKPAICKFKYQRTVDLPKTYLEDCAVRTGFKKLLLLGDSNGLRHSYAMDALFQASGFSCKVLKSEHPKVLKMPDATYFTKDIGIDIADINVRSKECSGCNSKKLSCLKNVNATQLNIEVEFISMEFLQDAEITTSRKVYSKQCPPAPARCLVSTTYQQFIFGEYFHNNYPDIIIIFGNSHDLRRRSLRQIRLDMQTLLGLLKEYVPKTTKVVWFGSPGENIQKKPELWQHEVFRLHSENWTTNGMIQRINNELFKVLEPELTRADGNILPFFDIEAIGRDLLGSWSLDGVHMRGEWYQHIIAYLMQTQCNSKITP